jgi:hypothetical protein
LSPEFDGSLVENYNGTPCLDAVRDCRDLLYHPIFVRVAHAATAGQIAGQLIQPYHPQMLVPELTRSAGIQLNERL